MRPNRLRELLDQDLPSLGTHVHSPWPSVIEMVGHSGHFDYVEYVAEYAPHDLHTMEHLARAIELFDNFTGMIKVEAGPSGWIANRAMGAGIQNLLFADLRTVQDVEAAVKSVRADLPGKGGEHGVHMRRSVRFGVDAGTPDFLDALDDAVIAIMIEKQSAVENLEEILSVPGVDMVQFGPGDYSMSIGQPRSYGAPEVMEAERYVIETSLRMGKHPRVELGGPTGIETYLDMGVRHFCIGADVTILMNWFRENGEVIRQILPSV